MSRHLGMVDWYEYSTLISKVIEWLEEHDVAGSIATNYSLYRALEEEWARARGMRLEELPDLPLEARPDDSA